MSRSRRRRAYRELTTNEYDKAYFVGFKLEELLEPHAGDTFDELLLDLTRRARRRVVGVFKEERELHRGKHRSTDNYIVVWIVISKVSSTT